MLEHCKNSNYVPELFETLVKTLREANKLPTHSDFSYFHQFPEFTSSITDSVSLSKSLRSSLSSLLGLPLSTFSEIEQAATRCLSTVDSILLDLSEPRGLDASLAFSLAKPQNSLKCLTDNSYSPFLPNLLYKYHAKVDLPASILKSQQLRLLNAREDHIEALTEQISHPYEHELESLEYLQTQFNPSPSFFAGLESTPLEFVSTEQDFYRMMQELRQSSEIAVDLENHSLRSYQGLCCLVQISTRTKDYIVDPLAISEQMPILGVVLADPCIVKVLHGSDMDIEWLQRDFGLYVVNMFDTGVAAKELRYPSASLAFLLKSFCDVDTDKRYQLADWRLRPLSKEMIRYARIDTHYLLYIYDRIREELIHKDLQMYRPTFTAISQVLEWSRNICMKVYRKSRVQEDPTNSLFYKLMKARDFIARIEDENVEFVMPQTLLLASAGGKPQTVEELMQLEVTTLVEKHAKYILRKVQGRKRESEVKKDLTSDFFKDCGWIACEKLPYFETFQSIKTSETSTEQVLQEVGELINNRQDVAQEGLVEGKLGFDINEILEGTVVDEKCIPQTMEEIFNISNNCRKKNKSKQKTFVEESTLQEKCTNVNLNKIFMELGWGGL